MTRARIVSILTCLALVASTQTLKASAEEPSSEVLVKAGVGIVDATWHVGAGAGQYASNREPHNEAQGDMDPNAHNTKRVPSYGVQSRLTVRAIVVEGSNGERVALVKTDNYLAQDLLQRRVAQILAEGDSGITYDRILIAATHNHSSPYNVTPAWGVQLFQDAFDLRMFEYQARALAQAIEEAAENFVPARMGATTVDFSIYKGNVVGPALADDGTPAGYPLDYGDNGLVVMRFDDLSDPADPQPLAIWMNYGQHPESLDGYNLTTADFLGPLERFVERETGAPLVFSQGDVGSAEGPYEDWNAGRLEDGTHRTWAHVGYAQTERGARYFADAVIQGFDEIAAGGGQVPYSSDFPVGRYDAWIPGPVSHPYPTATNCRAESTAEGNPGPPIGLPSCERGLSNDPNRMVWENLKEHGIPLPEHYGFPSFMAVEENNRLRLQAFRLGEVLLASCACEAQVDLILNLESRADNIAGNVFDGYEWDCAPNEDSTWTCPTPAAEGGSVTVSDSRYRRMQAQVHNDARGWDEVGNAIAANGERNDPNEIWGNFTKEELSPDLGFTLPVGVGHAGDYNGYTVSYREYMSRDHYRKALTSYGPHTADYMVTRLVRMAGALKGGPPLEEEPLQGAGELDEGRQHATAVALGQASIAAYDEWMASLPDDLGPVEALAQPDDIQRFDAATFTWRGGSNAVDNPTVVVERQTADGWEFYADQTGEIQTIIDFPDGFVGVATTRLGQQEWKWTASFEAFDYGPSQRIDPRGPQVPNGEYRFVVTGDVRQAGRTEPYNLVSEPFKVSPWEGIEVGDIRAEEDGTVSFEIAPIVYPRTYESPIPFIADDGRRPICRTCTFRPWAEKGEVATADLTVVRTDGSVALLPASRQEDGRWKTSLPIFEGDRAFVDTGGVRDAFGEINGGSTATVSGTKPRPNPEPEAASLAFSLDSAQEGQYSDEALIEVRLQTADGSPISDREVSFELSGEDGAITWTQTTDEHGLASKAILLSQRPGSYWVTARFRGSHEFTAAEDARSFGISREDSVLNLARTGKGSKSRLIADLSDADSLTRGISSAWIEFVADGESLGRSVTDESGRATLTIPPRHRNDKSSFSASFEGNDFYEPSLTTTGFLHPI